MVAVHELSWEEVSSPTFEAPARQAWRQAVAEIAAKATEAVPTLTGPPTAAVTAHRYRLGPRASGLTPHQLTDSGRPLCGLVGVWPQRCIEAQTQH